MTPSKAHEPGEREGFGLSVTVVTGFLGAGKTTLVNEWLAAVPRGDIAVIVNELGAVGIDGELLAARARVLYEISGGCICCTTQAELIGALEQLTLTQQQPQRVVVETSGAASPAGVLNAITRRGQSGVRLDGVITVIDATRWDVVSSQDLALEQLGYADVVVLSRSELCGVGAIQELKAELLARNPAAVVVEAAGGKLCGTLASSLEEVLDLRRAAPFEPRLTLPDTASHAYQSVALCHDGEVDGELFGDFMEGEVAQVAGRIFRVKGILGVAGLRERLVVQGVGDSVEVTLGEPWGEAPRRSRLVVVGFGLDEVALRHGFEGCWVADASKS